FAVPYNDWFFASKVHDGRWNQFSISPINDQVGNVPEFFINQFGIGCVFYDFVFIMNGSGQDGIPQFPDDGANYVVVGNPDTNRLLLSLKIFGNIAASFENECKGSRNVLF